MMMKDFQKKFLLKFLATVRQRSRLQVLFKGI
jgi:hypothetical protein